MVRLVMLRAACLATIALSAIGHYNDDAQMLQAAVIALGVVVLLLVIALVKVPK